MVYGIITIMKEVVKGILIGIILFLVILILVFIFLAFQKEKNVYYAKDFNIDIVLSDKDYNNNGIDDYTDILLGAKKDAENKPKYVSAYYSGGYPPENEGVCTDLVWRALANAGYSLKDLVSEDIENNLSEYPRVDKPDSNIDFRRVPNLKVFFDRKAQKLTTDIYDIAEWQPGDIVIFGTDHIGIISDKRNKNGVPYLLHNGGQPNREENILEWYIKYVPISGHYRWNLK